MGSGIDTGAGVVADGVVVNVEGLFRASSKPASSRDRFREGDGLVVFAVVVPLASPDPAAGYDASSVDGGANWNGSWEGESTMAGPSLFIIRGDMFRFLRFRYLYL